MSDEVPWVPIAAVEHWAYCPRQAALIHVDREWEDNRQTAFGLVAHRVVDDGELRHQPGRRLHHSVPVRSDRHRFRGICDAIEEDLGTGELAPVEHKSGGLAGTPALPQLVLQAIAVEEMTAREAKTGYFFLRARRRRSAVPVGEPALRAAALDALRHTRTVLRSVSLPLPVNDSRCPPCSLYDICLPTLS